MKMLSMKLVYTGLIAGSIFQANAGFAADVFCRVMPLPGFSLSEVQGATATAETTYVFSANDRSSLTLRIQKSPDAELNGTHILSPLPSNVDEHLKYLGNYRVKLPSGRGLYVRDAKNSVVTGVRNHPSTVEGDWGLSVAVNEKFDRFSATSDLRSAIRICATSAAKIPNYFKSRSALGFGSSTHGFASELNRILKNRTAVFGQATLGCRFDPAHRAYGVNWPDRDLCKFENPGAFFFGMNKRRVERTVLSERDSKRFIEFFGELNREIDEISDVDTQMHISTYAGRVTIQISRPR